MLGTARSSWCTGASGTAQEVPEVEAADNEQGFLEQKARIGKSSDKQFRRMLRSMVGGLVVWQCETRKPKAVWEAGKVPA